MTTTIVSRLHPSQSPLWRRLVASTSGSRAKLAEGRLGPTQSATIWVRFPDRFAGIWTQVFIGSYVAKFTAGFDYRFFPSSRSHRHGEHMYTRGSTTAVADLLRGFDTFKSLSTIISSAAAGQSLTTDVINSHIDLVAIAPPPRRPHESPGLTETELSTSRWRHSTNLSMRYSGPDIAVGPRFCFAFGGGLAGMQQESGLRLLEHAMEPHVGELLRMKRFDALAALVKHRWGIAPTTKLLQWLHEIAFLSPKPSVGGTPESPWSNPTWLMWIKNRLDEFSRDPTLASDPASRYGPPFEIERDPANVTAWRNFLDRYSKELLATEDLSLYVNIPDKVREAGWMGFAPAGELTLREAESRLGRKLPPSLRCFYSVSNGWRATGRVIHDVLPVAEIGWLVDREPQLYELALQAESEPGPFKNDSGDQRLKEHRDEEGTRVKRSLVISSRGDAATWLLDPGAEPHDGEWPAGCWASWHPAMSWQAANFAEPMAREIRMLREL